MKKFKKNLIDPVTTTAAIGLIAIKTTFEAIIGWMAVKWAEHVWIKFKKWRRDHGKDSRPDQGVPQQEQEKTP